MLDHCGVRHYAVDPGYAVVYATAPLLQGDVSAAAAGAVLLESLQRPETAMASL